MEIPNPWPLSRDRTDTAADLFHKTLPLIPVMALEAALAEKGTLVPLTGRRPVREAEYAIDCRIDQGRRCG